MNFPIYKNDGILIEGLKKSQIDAVEIFKGKIASGEYKFVENQCLCGNEHAGRDIVIAEKDRYAIQLQNILCSKCGLIRSGKVLDEKSNIEFYGNDYRAMYGGNTLASENYFKKKLPKGERLLRAFNEKAGNTGNLTVFEIGCSAGSVLFPFKEAGHKCMGCDFNQSYLDYGRSKGMDLKYGDYQEVLDDESVDLIILSHVMEHFTEPVSEITSIIKKVKHGGFLIVDIPGIFSIYNSYVNLLLYFQNAHVFNFYYDYLKVFFETFGLNIIYGDEQCLFILQKPDGWIGREISYIYDDSLSLFPESVKKYIKRTYLHYQLCLNPRRQRMLLGKLFNRFRMRT